MPLRLVYFNGDFVSERDARISIFDSALMFGDMVFEMTRSFKQKPYRLRNHLDRLYASMKYARIDCGLSIEEMESATDETIERNLPALEGLDYQIMHNVTLGALIAGARTDPRRLIVQTRHTERQQCRHTERPSSAAATSPGATREPTWHRATSSLSPPATSIRKT